MHDDHDHDPMILDDWEEEQRERPERGQGKHILKISPVSNFYSINIRGLMREWEGVCNNGLVDGGSASTAQGTTAGYIQ